MLITQDMSSVSRKKKTVLELSRVSGPKLYKVNNYLDSLNQFLFITDDVYSFVKT